VPGAAHDWHEGSLTKRAPARFTAHSTREKLMRHTSPAAGGTAADVL